MFMFKYALGAFALWSTWQVADHFLEADDWLWRAGLLAGGVGWAALNRNELWLGLGVGGVAAFLGVVGDALLLTGDAAKVYVLRNSQPQ